MNGQNPPEDVIAEAMERAFGGAVPKTIGVAVSGGGDSMALLDLLRRWGRAAICIASVNHGLRHEAADELALVAQYAARHGLSHDILNWHWDGSGNLQAAARDGRREALRDWAVGRGIAHVALGHTADDQAETFLMRLARGSGVDGLAGMADVRLDGAVTWLRPALHVRRDALRAHLKAVGLVWADDPSNEDTRFDRVKARQMMDVLAQLGLNVDRLVQTSDHMARERDVLHWAGGKAKAGAAKVVAGDVVFDSAEIAALPVGLVLRLFADALCFVSGETYRPRFRALRAALKSGKGATLHGCLILSGKNHVTITRELRAVQGMRVAVGTIWDGRWSVTGPETQGLEVAALGEGGLSQCVDWRDTGAPRPTLLASPAVWRGEELIAAPLAGFGKGWYADLVHGRAVFV